LRGLEGRQVPPPRSDRMTQPALLRIVRDKQAERLPFKISIEACLFPNAEYYETGVSGIEAFTFRFR